MKDKNVLIVGAGPAGCYTAHLLSAKGFNVTVVEEHEQIGKPVQCAGIVSSEIENMLDISKDYLVNKIYSAKVYGPNQCLKLNLKKPNYVIDRAKFDSHLANKAKSKGAQVLLSHKYLSYDKGNSQAQIKDKTTGKVKKFQTHILIGADGPLSRVAKTSDLTQNKQFWTGLQVRAKIKHENMVEFYPYIGCYAWVIPESKKVARLGVVSEKNTADLLQKFLDKRLSANDSIIDRQAGLIPKYSFFRKIQLNNTYLVGDAAGQVKALTGGGIVPGLIASRKLVESLTKNKDYDKLVRQSPGKNLLLNNFMRKSLDRFSPEDYDLLIRMLNQQKVRKIMQETERDFPSKYLFRIILKQPGLLRFLPKLFI